MNSGKGYQINFASGFESQGPYIFTIENGKLPAGLTLSNTGLISGTPTEFTIEGNKFATINVAAYDKFGTRATRFYVIRVPSDSNPVPIDDAVTINQVDGSTLVDVLANDLFPLDNVLPFSSVIVNDGVNGTNIPAPTHGKVSIFGTKVNYTPDAGFVGTDTFGYSIREDNKQRIGSVNITVNSFSFVVDNVTNIFDGKYGKGELSLLEAIELSNSRTTPKFPGHQIITFDSKVFSTPQVITLGETPLVIQEDGVDIIGPGAGLLTINGNSSSSTQGVFVNFAKSTISGLTIANGNRDNGGGVLNIPNLFISNPPLPELTLNECIIRNNRSFSTEADGGIGGGIYNLEGKLIINNCTISNNTAVYQGGGIGNIRGTVIVQNSTISNNNATLGGGIFNTEGDMTI